MTERTGTFIKWVDKDKGLATISFTGPIDDKPKIMRAYDYTLWPCMHEVLNQTYKPSEIDGMLHCPECKKIQEIWSITCKRY
jgi:hypothetical protein